MNRRHRCGLTLLVLAACWLEAAPHSGAGEMLAVASVFGQIIGSWLLLGPFGEDDES